MDMQTKPHLSKVSQRFVPKAVPMQPKSDDLPMFDHFVKQHCFLDSRLLFGIVRGLLCDTKNFPSILFNVEISK